MLPRNLEDLSEFEKLFLIEMSYSRLSTYDMCSAKYFYGYVIQEPRRFGAAAALGNVLHKVLEEHVGEELSLPEMLVSFEQARAFYDPNNEIDNTLIEAGTSMLQEYVDRHAQEQVEVLGKELEFKFVLGTAFIRGYIDRIDRLSPTKIEIIDYKSGKYQEVKKRIHLNLQLNIYFLALSLLYPEVEEFSTNLYYLRTGKLIGHTFYRSDIEGSSELVLDAINTVIDDQYFHYTPNERMCSFCDHAASGVCSTGVKRNMKQKKFR